MVTAAREFLRKHVLPAAVILAVAASLGSTLLLRDSLAPPSSSLRFGAPASSQGGPRYTAGANITIDPTTNVISASGGGGFAGAWSAGTYTAGQTVTRGPFLLAATTSTALDPCLDFNDVSDNSLWQLNGTGASQDVPNKVLTLANSTSQSSSVIYKTNTTGWNHRRLIVDAEIMGTADGISFGILDGSLASTTSPSAGMAGVTGFWGVDIEIYSGGTPGYFIVHNGTSDPIPFADTNSNETNAGDSFDRYYVDYVDNGAGAGTVTITLSRNAYPSTTVTNRGWSIDVVQLGTWTVTRPTFTNWKFALGAHTGGSSGTFKVRHAWARDTSGAWTAIALLPTRS